MTRLVLSVVALLVACGLADPVDRTFQRGVAVDATVAQRQLDIQYLYYRVHEPFQDEKYKSIAHTWDIEKNIGSYNNATAVKIYVDMVKNKWTVPRAIPFAVLNDNHKMEAVILFNVLYSAKDYETFFKTAVYLRERVNEQLYIYVLSAVIVHRRDTQGVTIPPLYEVFPSFFNNGEIMTTAQRINTHGFRMIENYPSTYKWDENVVIRWNATAWPYAQESSPISYFTHDPALNTLYYNYYLIFPQYLGAGVLNLIKENRGEWFWFTHKQLLARYYMERLSNGLGEIPELNTKLFEEGYTSGLLYHNGVPFPSRSNFFLLDQPDYTVKVQEATEYERRIRNAIDQGFITVEGGKRIELWNPEGIDVLARMIEGSEDSPNANYFKDFISIWKSVLGNSYLKEHQYVHNFMPLVVPSALENYQTALRDPAFYAIWKRVMNLFTLWQQYLPHYTHEQLALPSVAIEKVETDKLVTYFENTYMNVSNHLHTKDHSKGVHDDFSVLVQRPRLNHKVFKTRIHVKSDVAKRVTVRFYLAPKYDSKGNEIPLVYNTENFYLLDTFTYNLTAGESVITRDSTDNYMTGGDWHTAYELFLKAEKAVSGAGKFVVERSQRLDRSPHRLLLPKGRVGGMPYVLAVYINEFKLASVAYGTGFDSNVDLGIGTGARRYAKDPLGFPFDRPLNPWQIEGLSNIHFEDVLIHHKHTPEIYVPHSE